ncbi:MAG: PHB depolymerase family esterase [Pseudomonadota bacterium]
MSRSACRAVLVFLCCLLAAAPALAEEAGCGAGGRCDVADGYYLAAPPADWDGASPLPLIVYFHGWNASPEATFRNRAMLSAAHQRGALFVAPWAQTGYWRQIGAGRAERGRDEAAYIRAVMADVTRRWPIDPARTLASGFSRGASMVWNVACYEGALFAGYLPIAGGFWNSTPEACPSAPVRLRHIHGTADRVVAWDRVGIYNSMAVPEGLSLLASEARCSGPPAPIAAPEADARRGRLLCRAHSGCEEGGAVEMCLHPGGHSIPAEWVAEGLDWLATLPR